MVLGFWHFYIASILHAKNWHFFPPPSLLFSPLKLLPSAKSEPSYTNAFTALSPHCIAHLQVEWEKAESGVTAHTKTLWFHISDSNQTSVLQTPFFKNNEVEEEIWVSSFQDKVSVSHHKERTLFTALLFAWKMVWRGWNSLEASCLFPLLLVS